MKRKRRPVVFVFRYAIAGGIKRAAVLLEPEHRQEALRSWNGRFLDRRPVPKSWSGEAKDNT